MTPEAIMAHHARSFAPAARLLAKRERLLVARLYALCRTIDDIADEIGGPIGQDKLQKVHDDLLRPNPRDPLAIEAHNLFKDQPLGLAALAELVRTAAADTGNTCIIDAAALDTYCMGVAGTVGVMICAIFNVDAAYHAKAADLGKAMQLTNICRDVAEDARIGRRYLPQTQCPYSPKEIAAGDLDAIAAAEASMAVLLNQAGGLYVSGRSALGTLPFRLRLAVASAAAMYEGIGTQLRQRNYQPLAGRAFVPTRRKISLASRAILAEIVQKRKFIDGPDHAKA
jgi:phytoene synthase